MTPNRQVILGAFFVIVLGFLGYYTLVMTEFSLFKKTHKMVVHFPDAHGLRTGDGVLVAGIRKGRVKTLTFDPTAPPDLRITVELLLDEETPLREGFVIRIEDATLLGGKDVYIDPGLASAALIPKDQQLLGTVAGNALSDLGKFIDENRESVQRIVSNVDEVVAGVKDGKGIVGRLLKDEALANTLTDGVNKLQKSADNVAALTDDVRAGKGVIGRLFTDEELATKLSEIGDRLSAITDDFKVVSADLKEGKGVLGRALNDEKMGEDVAKAIETIRSVVDKINAGEGTLGKLITDPTMANDLQEIISMTRRGEGTLGALFVRDDIYKKLAQVSDDLAVASDALRNAKGTIGKLWMDPELYADIQKAVNTVTRTLEEFREAAPITTFTTVLFGAF